MSDQHYDVPVLWDTTAAPSIFEPAHWFEYCERIDGRPRPVLPRFAIQSVIPAHMKIICERHGTVPDNFTLADHPFALFEHDGIEMVLATSAKGSYASGGLDEMIALGVRHVIFLGGAGAISDEIEVDDLFIPTKALRDECVSFHYLPPSRYAHPSQRLTNALLTEANGHSRPVKSGPAWTIMAHFRQARPRLEAFRDEGCLVVNNEAAPAFAVGQARGVDVAALLNIGDTLAHGRFEVPVGHAKLYQIEDAAPQLDIAIAALARFARATER